MSKSQNQISELEQDKKNEITLKRLIFKFQEYGSETSYLLEWCRLWEATVDGFDAAYMLEEALSEDQTIGDVEASCKKNRKKANAKPKWKPTTHKKRHAYNYFVIVQNQKYKDAKSELSFKERSSAIKNLWEEVKGNPTELKVYKDMADQDRDRYDREIAVEREQAIADGLLPPDRDVNKPKKALNAYFFWLKDNRESITQECELKGPLLNKELGSRWRQMDDVAKERWLQMALDDKERFKREMQEYNDNLALEGASDDEVIEAIQEQVAPSVPVAAPVPVPVPVPVVVAPVVLEPEPEPKPEPKKVMKPKKQRKRRVRKKKVQAAQ